ncbi:MAG: MAPEG family protein [Gammaproteobacteria bacterium]
MTFDYWCIFFTFLFPYILIVFAKGGCSHYDNHASRSFMENLQGWRKRTYWAHQNSFEVFAPFAVAVMIAHQLQVSAMTLNTLAAIFVVSRILYALCYVADKATLRSLIWIIGFFATIGLFIAAARV